ncbi:MAG TPA: hypothetical protein PLI66_09870, partial [Spirochaetales bacterium]|nr:hypothetical protein [Spirochaetales bacterium]
MAILRKSQSDETSSGAPEAKPQGELGLEISTESPEQSGRDEDTAKPAPRKRIVRRPVVKQDEQAPAQPQAQAP